VNAALATVLCVWLAAALVYRVLAFRALTADARSALRAIPTHASRDRVVLAPSHVALLRSRVALLRPLHGAPAPTEACLESLFQAAARGDAEIVLGFARADDPVRAIVERVRARWPSVACGVHVGEGPPGANRKVANLVQMDAEKRGDIVVLSDADVRVAPDFVARIAAPFDDASIGLATCAYTSAPAASLASRVDALMTNTHFIPSACLAVRLEGLHFGLGAVVAVRRAALEAAGGFEALLAEPADDYAIARNVERAGSKLAWAPLFVDHVLGDEGWRSMFARHLRWAEAMRSVRSAGYAGLVATHGVVAALGAAFALGVNGASVPLLWWCATVACAWPVRSALGMRALDFALLPIADLFAFAAWIGGFFRAASPP
jgi:ceramide glucosyltransferase